MTQNRFEENVTSSIVSATTVTEKKIEKLNEIYLHILIEKKIISFV